MPACHTCGNELAAWTPLTDWQLKLAEMLANESLSLALAGEALGLKERSMKHRSHALYAKLGIRNRVDLMRYWPCELFQIGIRQF
ncbi:MAG: hypothetical protein JWQ87_5483 [Candidatus Sulfotelmatobacter sp.]|nr:hypothetical protein [Candidatus Sulfotelmatobacter sp.]